MWSPHPFHWVPAGGQRHASTDAHPNGGHLYPDGTAVTTLCGVPTTSAKNGGGLGFADDPGSTRPSNRSPSSSA